MKRFSVLTLVLSALAAVACNKMDSTYREYLKDGPITYTERIDSINVYSGRQRVLVTWKPIHDPRVSKVKVLWSSGSESVEIPITSPQDTLTYIDGLSEGNYVFDFYTYDDEGNRSVKTEAVGMVYDVIYESGLILRDVSGIVLSGSSLTLTFRSMVGVAGYHAQEVMYTSSIDHREKMVTLPGTESELTIDDFSGESFRHRSVYKPQVLSPDLFYSRSKIVDINEGVSQSEYSMFQ